METAGPPAEDLPNTLTVTKEGVPEDIAVFAVGVSGDLAPNENAEATIRGSRALDWVGPEAGTDTVSFSGDITTFLLKGRAAVSVNGSDVDPDELGSDG